MLPFALALNDHWRIAPQGADFRLVLACSPHFLSRPHSATQLFIVGHSGQGGSMIKTHGLSHIALSVRDPDRALAFYSSVFGVREYFRDRATIQALGPGPKDVLAFERRPAGAGVPGGIIHFGFRLTAVPMARSLANTEQFRAVRPSASCAYGREAGSGGRSVRADRSLA